MAILVVNFYFPKIRAIYHGPHCTKSYISRGKVFLHIDQRTAA